MNLPEYIRNKGFRLFDFLKGNPIQNHYLDIKNAMTGSDPFSEHTREIVLSNILTHAAKSTAFYSNFYKAKFNDFPVVDKNTIRENFESFISDGLPKNKYIEVVTSGSTGTPFRVLHDRNKKYRNLADTIYFSELAGYRIGLPLIYMKIWAKQKMKSPYYYWIQNILPIDVLKLDNDKLSKLFDKLKKSNNTYSFLAYASALEELSRYLNENHNNQSNSFKVSSIIAMSESLNEYTRQSLKKHFNVTTVSRYSNLENGIIAQQLLNKPNLYLVNKASYFVEILAFDSDKAVAPGNLGRIVITDLFNYAMPFIRYDTGDIGAVSINNELSGNVYLSTVEGRKMDQLFDTRGNLISSFIMYKNMWQYTEIKQYQLIQEGLKDYTFMINAEPGFRRETQLVGEFKHFLGEDANFKVQYVNEIPLLSSGKRRKIVNNYYRD